MEENNTIRNIAGIFVAFMCVLVFFIGLGALDTLRTGVNNAINSSATLNNTLNDSTYSTLNNNYTDLRTTALSGLNFILVIVVLFSFYSSFISKNDLMGYVINFIGGIVISAIMLYLMSAIYNSFTAAIGSYVSISDIPLWFFDNLTNIILMNIVAGTLSFIFVRRDVVA